MMNAELFMLTIAKHCMENREIEIDSPQMCCAQRTPDVTLKKKTQRATTYYISKHETKRIYRFTKRVPERSSIRQRQPMLRGLPEDSTVERL